MLLAPLETVLNRNIAASTSARTACKRLKDQTLAVHVTGAPEKQLLSLYFTSNGERVSISSTSDAVVATSLSGSPFAFLSMVGKQPESALRAGRVRIEGDAEVAQAFRDLLESARPDFEEELSRLVGDVAAHQLGNFARGALQLGKRVADTFAQNMSEYLQEESRDVVTRVELDEFMSEVDRVREAVDRADARLALLEKSAKK